ncbi:hypothetical protein ACLOJK_021258 [Asimina triloba]
MGVDLDLDGRDRGDGWLLQKSEMELDRWVHDGGRRGQRRTELLGGSLADVGDGGGRRQALSTGRRVVDRWRRSWAMEEGRARIRIVCEG